MISLPHEITLLVFRHLPQTDRKQLRLASKTFASVGALVLIDTIYISPYRQDIEVFNKITSHPILSKGVKHLVYDTAQFHLDLSQVDYYNLLCHNFHLVSSYMTSINVTITVYDDLSNLVLLSEAEPRFSHRADTQLGLRLCQSQSAFRDGYKQYRDLAEEMFQLRHGQSRANNTSWFQEVLDGLIKLGPIRSVTLDNSFAKRHSVGMEALYDVDLYGTGQILDGYTTRAMVRSNGTRPVGSPLARSWPPHFLQPITRHSLALAMGEWNRLDSRGIYPKGHFELDTVLQLLKSAAKLPEVQKISALRGSFDTDAVTHCIFETKGLGSPLIIEASMTLKILELEFAYVMDDDPDFDMGILRSFLENASSLQAMSLDFQSRLKEDGIREHGKLLHSSTEMFPPFAKWRVPNLSTLKLRGVSFPYRELAGLLFANLPRLKSLIFHTVQLTEGRWEDIVEGLRRLRDLIDCHIGGKRGIVLPMSAEDVVDEGRLDFVRDGPWRYMSKIDRYVLHGGRHPFLPHDAPASASDQYFSRLNETLRKLRATCV